MQTLELGSIVADVLQRSATPEEVATLQARLATGTTVDALVRQLILGPDPEFPSGECIETVFPVIRFYQGVYGRLPDKEGLAYWWVPIGRSALLMIQPHRPRTKHWSPSQGHL